MDDATDLQQLRNHLLEGMRDHIAGLIDSGGETHYTGADVGRCGDILDDYLAFAGAAEHGDADTVLFAVRHAVQKLNALNDACHGHLIETDQREQIVELMVRAAGAAGVGGGEDLTEAWREW